jgi:prepilin-type N-terminal cleavage/methylation domain-containing protein
MQKKNYRAFSLIEISIVILIIGILVAGVTKSRILISKSQLTTARTLTQSSAVSSIPNLVMWLETTSTSSLTNSNNSTDVGNGDNIATWNDIGSQLTAPNSPTQSTTTSQPVYTTNVINGLPALNFNGTSNYFSLSTIVSTSFSAFVVAKTAVAGTAGAAYGGNGVLWSDYSQTAYDIIPLAIGGGVTQFMTGGATDSTLTGTTNVSDNKFHIINVTRDSTTGIKYIYVDGNQDASETHTIGTLAANPILGIGANITDSHYFNGYLAEIIIFGRVLKSEERESVRLYLKKKWGI